MFMSDYQNAGQNCCARISNVHFENVATFKYLGTTGKWELRTRIN